MILRVQWDPGTKRFYYSAFLDTTGANVGPRLMVGYSRSASPSGPADFCHYSFDVGGFPDAPRLGGTVDFVLVRSANSSVTGGTPAERPLLDEERSSAPLVVSRNARSRDPTYDERRHPWSSDRPVRHRLATLSRCAGREQPGDSNRAQDDSGYPGAWCSSLYPCYRLRRSSQRAAARGNATTRHGVFESFPGRTSLGSPASMHGSGRHTP